MLLKYLLNLPVLITAPACPLVHTGRPFWFAWGVALHPSHLPRTPLIGCLTLILGSCLLQLQIPEQSNLSPQHRWSLWQGEREVRPAL